jgi:hypothetical protein
MQSTSDLRLPAPVAGEHSVTAPNASVQGTAVPCAGPSPAVHADTAVRTRVAVRPVLVAPFAGARSIDLLGLLPRGAPV